MTLHCMCCGEAYARGRYRCCAPPKNTPSHNWLGSYCRECKHCPKHCTCETITPRVAAVRPLAELAKQAAASLLSPGQRLRDLRLALETK